MHKLGICISSILLVTLIFVNLTAVDVLSDNCNHSSENKICKEISLSEGIKVNDYSKNISTEFSNIRKEIEAATQKAIKSAERAAAAAKAAAAASLRLSNLLKSMEAEK